jgi:preprotein translocase subunit Sss1
VKHKDDRAEEAYEEIKNLKEFQLEVSRILGTTRKPMLEEIRELKHRAEVAEEALRNGAVGEDLYCSSDDERHRLYLHLIREAEERLKEAEKNVQRAKKM